MATPSPQTQESVNHTPPDPWAEAHKWLVLDGQIGQTHHWSAYFLRRFDNLLKIVATAIRLAAGSAALVTATSRTTVGLLALVGGLCAGLPLRCNSIIGPRPLKAQLTSSSTTWQLHGA